VARKYERSLSRQEALQLLYQSEIRSTATAELIGSGTVLLAQELPAEDQDEPLVKELALDEYARYLVDGVCSHREELDARIAAVSENWSISRMPILDLNVLRIALFELLFAQDIPASVAINEAVELAKDYGTDESSKFVNGILGCIAREIEAQQGTQEAGE